jgi:hypothetical protein
MVGEQGPFWQAVTQGFVGLVRRGLQSPTYLQSSAGSVKTGVVLEVMVDELLLGLAGIVGG